MEVVEAENGQVAVDMFVDLPEPAAALTKCLGWFSWISRCRLWTAFRRPKESASRCPQPQQRATTAGEDSGSHSLSERGSEGELFAGGNAESLQQSDAIRGAFQANS